MENFSIFTTAGKIERIKSIPNIKISENQLKALGKFIDNNSFGISKVITQEALLKFCKHINIDLDYFKAIEAYVIY